MYVDAPAPVNVAELPPQIVPAFAVTVGKGFTVTSEVACAVHVAVVPRTVYVVVVLGLAVTLAPVVELKPVAGLNFVII